MKFSGTVVWTFWAQKLVGAWHEHHLSKVVALPFFLGGATIVRYFKHPAQHTQPARQPGRHGTSEEEEKKDFCAEISFGVVAGSVLGAPSGISVVLIYFSYPSRSCGTMSRA